MSFLHSNNHIRAMKRKMGNDVPICDLPFLIGLPPYTITLRRFGL